MVLGGRPPSFGFAAGVLCIAVLIVTTVLPSGLAATEHAGSSFDRSGGHPGPHADGAGSAEQQLARSEALLGLRSGAKRDIQAAFAGLRALAASLDKEVYARPTGLLTSKAPPADVAAWARASYVLAALSSAPQLFRSPGDDGAGAAAGAADPGGLASGLDPVRLLQNAALAGSVDAHLALADRHFMGRGLPPSCEEGLWHLRLAAVEIANQVEKDGSNFHLPTAPVRLRERWSDAEAPQNDAAWDDADEVVSMEEDAAFRGDPTAQRRLGYRRLVGRGVPRDPASAYRAFTVAAEGGDAMALYNLGFMHLNAIHVPRDAAKAAEYFREAAARGVAAGHTGLGVIAYQGALGKPDLKAAREHFERGANGSNADAVFNLGNIYSYGLGVPRDAQEALHWYDKAYVAGHWRSPLALAMLYARGRDGIDFDCAEAERLLWQFVAERSAWTPGLSAALRALDAGRPWQALARYLVLAESGCEIAAANAAFMLQRGMGARGGGTLQLAAQLLHRSSVLNSTSSMVELSTLIIERPETFTRDSLDRLMPPVGTKTPYQDGYRTAEAAAARARARAAGVTDVQPPAAAASMAGGTLLGALETLFPKDVVEELKEWAGQNVQPWPPDGPAPQSALTHVASVWLRRAEGMRDSEAAYNLAWLVQHGEAEFGPLLTDPAIVDMFMAKALHTEEDPARITVLRVAAAALRLERWAVRIFGRAAVDTFVSWLQWLRDATPLSQMQPPAVVRVPDSTTPQQQQQQKQQQASPAGAGAGAGSGSPQQQQQQRAARVRPTVPRLELSVDRVGGGWGAGGGPTASGGHGTAGEDSDDSRGAIADLLRTLGAEKVAADDVLLTVMLGALAAVMWARNRQMNGQAAGRGAAAAQQQQQARRGGEQQQSPAAQQQHQQQQHQQQQQQWGQFAAEPAPTVGREGQREDEAQQQQLPPLPPLRQAEEQQQQQEEQEEAEQQQQQQGAEGILRRRPPPGDGAG